jgi:hypothetical protein
MNEGTIIVVVLAASIAGIVGIANVLDRRRKTHGPIGLVCPPARLGPVGQALQWLVLVLVVAMALSVIGVFVFRAFWLAWVAGGCLLAVIVMGRILGIFRLIGK